jgi:drug/metabolite transporter (DMT)-like permease
MTGELLGEAASLTAAFLWALSVALFRNPVRAHGAPAVNLVKCAIASVLLGATTVAFGQLGLLVSAPSRDLAMIVVSAVIGLVIGDTALFAAVARIGPYRTLLLGTLAPVFTAALAAAWQHEIPTGRQAAGVVLILVGIVLVVMPPRGASAIRWHAVPVAGIALGVLAAAGQGIGVVFAKEGMQEVPFLAASFLRMVAAVVGLAIVAIPGGRLLRAIRVAGSRDMGRIGVASFLGAYVAMACMMAGIYYAPAAVAAVLLATTPVFSMFIDAYTLGERITVRGVTGTMVAVAGVVVLT